MIAWIVIWRVSLKRKPKFNKDIVIVGIDPGITGAAIALNCNAKVLGYWEFKSTNICKPAPGFSHLTNAQLSVWMTSMWNWLDGMGDPRVLFFIEQPLQSTARIGAISWGHLQYLVGLLQAMLYVPSDPCVVLVKPDTWQRLFIHKANGKDKRPAKERVFDYLSEHHRGEIPLLKTNTGLNDAFLIAHFGLKMYKEKHGDFSVIESACAV